MVRIFDTCSQVPLNVKGTLDAVRPPRHRANCRRPDERQDAPADSQKKEAKKIDLQPRQLLAEVHGNRTHLPPSSDSTPDLKSGGPTSEPRTSAATTVTGTFGSGAGSRPLRIQVTIIINPVARKDNPA